MAKIFADDDARRIMRAVEFIERMSDNNTVRDHRPRSPIVRFVRVTSTTTTNGMYPGKINITNDDSLSWDEYETCWVLPPDGEGLTEGYYPATLASVRVSDGYTIWRPFIAGQDCCPGYFGDDGSACCEFFGAPPSDCGCGEPDPPLPPYEPIPSPSCVRCVGEYWAWFDQFGVFMYWTQIPCTQEPPLEWPRCDSLPPQVPGIPGGGDPGGGPTRPDDGRRCHWEQNGQGQWEYRCFDFPGRATNYGPFGDQPFGGPAFGASGFVDATVYAETGITAGTYTNANITVGADGKLTSASSGTAAAVTQKTSDQSRASTTTLANDSTLTFSMAANTTYRIRLNVGWACGVGGFKYALTGPSSPTSVRIWRRHWNPSSLTPTEALDTSYTSSTSDSSSGGGMLIMDIVVQNGANSGTFALQWAQASSDASNTTVQAGSSMEVLTF